MLDWDLARLYRVETRMLKQAVRRNIERFPEDFMFELTQVEYRSLRSQIVILENRENMKGKHSKYLPYAFTEHGVAMLSSVLRTKKSVEVNISIMRAFIMLRQLAITHKELLKKIKELEKKYDKNFEEIYAALNMLLNSPKLQPRKKVGYKHYD